jgi:hypothetical protein
MRNSGANDLQLLFWQAVFRGYRIRVIVGGPGLQVLAEASSICVPQSANGCELRPEIGRLGSRRGVKAKGGLGLVRIGRSLA